MGNGPIAKFKDGAVELTAWANEKGWSWNIKKSYKDKKTDEWKESKYWYMSDLKKLKSLLDQAIDEGEEDDDERPQPKKERPGKVSFDDDSLPKFGGSNDDSDIPF